MSLGPFSTEPLLAVKPASRALTGTEAVPAGRSLPVTRADVRSRGAHRFSPTDLHLPSGSSWSTQKPGSYQRRPLGPREGGRLGTRGEEALPEGGGWLRPQCSGCHSAVCSRCLLAGVSLRGRDAGSHALGLVSGSPANVTQVSLNLSRLCVSVKDSGSPSLQAGTSHLLAEPPAPPAPPALLPLAVHTPHPILSSACASSFSSSCLCDQLSTGRRPSLL